LQIKRALWSNVSCQIGDLLLHINLLIISVMDIDGGGFNVVSVSRVDSLIDMT
jgi:hypothetical protein